MKLTTPPQPDDKLKALTVKAAGVGHWLRATVIRDAGALSMALEAMHVVKALHKEVENERHELVDPLNSTVRKLNAKFKPLAGKLEELERHIKTLVAAYEEIERGKQIQLAEKRALLAEKSGAMEVASDIRALAVRAPGISAPGVGFRDNWKARIVDPDKIPREYMEPNLAALNALAKDTRGKVEVPGVEFYNDRIVSARG